MKKFWFYVILIFPFLSSCCDQSPTSTSPYNVYFTDNLVIQKVTAVEINKTIDINEPVAYLTLNPKSNVSTFILYYAGGSGTISLSYTSQFSYENDPCSNSLRIIYDAKLKSTTFKDVQINPWYNKAPYIEITR